MHILAESGGVVLEVGELCIENTARRAFRRLQGMILEGGKIGPGEEEAFDLLRAFLQEEDFAALRSAHPDLCGGKLVLVRIFRDRDGKVRWARQVRENR